MNAELLQFQIKPSQDLVDNILANKSALLTGQAGSGKTYVIAAAIARLQQHGFYQNGQGKLCSILWLTKKSVKTQTRRVCKQFGLQHVAVESYDSMRAGFGEFWLDWVSKIVAGEIAYEPIWRNEDMPDLVIADECQSVKNIDALCSKVLLAYILQGGRVIFSSATPGVKFDDLQVLSYGLKLCNSPQSWHSLQNDFCNWNNPPSQPSPIVMRRFNEFLLERQLKVNINSPKFLHRTIIKTQLINFENDEQRAIYHSAFAEYQKVRAEKGRNPLMGLAAVWVAFLKFRQISEILRAPKLARIAIEINKHNNKQIIIACNFIDVLELVGKTLIKNSVKPDEISVIYGNQTEKVRQENIDKFQRGQSNYCLMILKCGGVGLSLDHQTGHKNARPRHVILPVTWSPIEMVQALGRAHRVLTQSTTYQDVVLYAGTIEERVKYKMDLGLHSLKELVTRKESWLDILNENVDSEMESKLEEEALDKDEAGESILDSIDLDNYNQ